MLATRYPLLPAELLPNLEVRALCDFVLNFLEDAVHFVVRQGSIVRAKNEAEREALLSVRQSLPFVEIKQRHLLDRERVSRRRACSFRKRLLHISRWRRCIHNQREVPQRRGHQAELTETSARRFHVELFGQNGKRAGVNLPLDTHRFYHRELQQSKTRDPAVRHITHRNRMTFLPSEIGSAVLAQRLSRKINSPQAGKRSDMMFNRVEIRRLTFQPRPFTDRLRDHEGDGCTLQVLSVPLDEYPSGFEQSSRCCAARLI